MIKSACSVSAGGVSSETTATRTDGSSCQVTVTFPTLAHLPQTAALVVDQNGTSAVVTLALAYISALAAFIRLMFRRHSFARAAAASVLPLLAIAVLVFLLYSAGAEPAEPKDKYQAWYIGIAVLISGVLIVMFGRPSKRSPDGGITRAGVPAP